MATIDKTTRISFVTMIALIIIFSGIRLKNPQQNVLSWDVFGFYLYLPATFIYSDADISDKEWVWNINNKYGNTETLYQLTPSDHGTNVIRFSPGMSIMMSPFFLCGHAYASMSEIDEADGFSDPYQWAIILSGIFYTIIGLIFLRKILLRYLSDSLTAISLAILYLSSNLFFFITYGNDIPHVYVFTLNVLIIWLTIRWHESHRMQDAVLLGLLLGLAAISRIAEVIMLAVPVLWGVYNIKTLRVKINLLIQYRIQVLMLILAGIIAVLPQLFYWKMAWGAWVFNAYTDASSSLDLFNPKFYYVLFGFRKGLFIYSPVMIFSIIGFYHLFKRYREAFFALLVVTIAHIYLIASFSSLVAYGWRAFIELYAVLAIPLASFIAAVYAKKLYIRIPVLALILFFTVLNMFQVWQFNNGVLDGYRMTKDYYWRVFFKTKVTEEDRKLMLVQRGFSSLEILENESDFNHTVVHDNSFEVPTEGNAKHYDTTYAHTGLKSFRMDETIEFSPTFRVSFNELSESYYGWVRASVWMYPTSNVAINSAVLVIAFRHGGQNYKYRSYELNADSADLVLNKWNLVTADYMTPELLSESDELEVYVWHPGKKDIWIDDLKVEFFEPKN